MYKISGLPTSFAVRKMELRLSSSQQELLKWVAIVLMVLDHVGFFLEQYAWLRYE
ncbi:TraX family protein [Marinospirillum minutulum]|uniref:TraX family protein n=1 Tax=Marinospirillum minutulum TaxID=64974 RepID=UPI0012EB8615